MMSIKKPSLVVHLHKSSQQFTDDDDNNDNEVDNIDDKDDDDNDDDDIRNLDPTRHTNSDALKAHIITFEV